MKKNQVSKEQKRKDKEHKTIEKFILKKDKIKMTAIFIIYIDRTIKQEALYKKQSIV